MPVVQDMQMLRLKSDDATASEAKALLEVLELQLQKNPGGIGLSAIQIGIPKKVSVIRTDNHVINLINSTILDLQDPFIHIKEGCLSIPNRYVNVSRFREVTIRNYRLEKNGEEDVLVPETLLFYTGSDLREGDGIAAIAVQHEIDHFDGVLMIDKIMELKAISIQPEPGRNDPCKCGSGVKYKNCCLRKK